MYLIRFRGLLVLMRAVYLTLQHSTRLCTLQWIWPWFFRKGWPSCYAIVPAKTSFPGSMPAFFTLCCTKESWRPPHATCPCVTHPSGPLKTSRWGWQFLWPTGDCSKRKNLFCLLGLLDNNNNPVILCELMNCVHFFVCCCHAGDGPWELAVICHLCILCNRLVCVCLWVDGLCLLCIRLVWWSVWGDDDLCILCVRLVCGDLWAGELCVLCCSLGWSRGLCEVVMICALYVSGWCVWSVSWWTVHCVHQASVLRDMCVDQLYVVCVRLVWQAVAHVRHSCGSVDQEDMLRHIFLQCQQRECACPFSIALSCLITFWFGFQERVK